MLWSAQLAVCSCWVTMKGRPYGRDILQTLGSEVRPRTVGCIAMGSAVLFILSSRLRLYSAGSGVNGVQVVVWI